MFLLNGQYLTRQVYLHSPELVPPPGVLHTAIPLSFFLFFKNCKAMATSILSFPFLVFLKADNFEQGVKPRKEKEHQKSRVHNCAPGDRPAEDLELRCCSVTEQQLQNQRECGWLAVEHTWDCSPVQGAEASCARARRAGAGLVFFWQGILFY